MGRTKEKARQHYKNNRIDYYFWGIETRYGLTREAFFELINSQNNKCAICDKSFKGLTMRQVHVDHCHETNKIRGILCMPCNVGLGMLGDNEEGLLKALAYIRGET